MAYTMRVVEIGNAREHDLPADTVTRDAPACSPPRVARAIARSSAEAERGGRASGPLLPLGFRPQGDVFYVSAERWPELLGKALRLKAMHRA